MSKKKSKKYKASKPVFKFIERCDQPITDFITAFITERIDMSKKQQTKQDISQASDFKAFSRKNSLNSVAGAFGPPVTFSSRDNGTRAIRINVALSPDVIPAKELYGSGVEVYGNEGTVSAEGLHKALQSDRPLMVYQWLYVANTGDIADRGRERAIMSIYHIRSAAAAGQFRALTGTMTDTGTLIVFDEYISKITEQEGSCIVSVSARLMCDAKTVSQYFEFTFEVTGTDAGRFHWFRTATQCPTQELLSHLTEAGVYPVAEFKQPPQENTMENKTTNSEADHSPKSDHSVDDIADCGIHSTMDEMQADVDAGKPALLWRMERATGMDYQPITATASAVHRIFKLFGVGDINSVAVLKYHSRCEGLIEFECRQGQITHVVTKLYAQPLTETGTYRLYVEFIAYAGTASHRIEERFLVNDGRVNALLSKLRHPMEATHMETQVQTCISFDAKTGTVSRDSSESSIVAGKLFNGTSALVDTRVSDSFVLEVVLEKLRHGQTVTVDTIQNLMRDVRERAATPGSEKINVVFVGKPN